jgi:virulence factor
MPCWHIWETDGEKITRWRGGAGRYCAKSLAAGFRAATDWTLQGAWSPTREKAERICETWRIPYAASLQDLARECDAVFVHTSTATHYQVVSELLNAGVHVCVDKPLAENVQDAERLIELAARKKLTLMVGSTAASRRFTSS